MSITNAISLTSKLTAAARARESKRADRLFEDPLAEAMAGPEGVALMDRIEAAARPLDSDAPADNPYIAIRTRFIDEFLAAEVARPELRQVALVGAGLDCRAFRLAWPADLRLFEIDLPEVLSAKQEILDRLGIRPTCDRRCVAADLATPWDGAIGQAGFDGHAPVLWVIEGLFPYLEEAVAHAVLANCSSLSAPGSRLFADAVSRTFLDSPWTQPYLKALERERAPWKFGTNEPEALLARHGWQATALRPGDEGASYGRWDYPRRPRNTPGVPESYMITATRA
jgi:methyltransferase (TIGR00027 family)